MKRFNFKMRNVATIVACLAVTMFFAGCDKTTEPENNEITYTVTASGSPATTVLNFVFSASVTDLQPNDIIITNGEGFASMGNLTGAGTNWSLAVTTSRAGNITIRIYYAGIENVDKTVTLIKTGGGGQTLTITGFDTEYVQLDVHVGTTTLETLIQRESEHITEVMPADDEVTGRTWYADSPVTGTLEGTTLTMPLPSKVTGTFNICMRYNKETVYNRAAAVIGNIAFDSEGNASFAWGDITEITPHNP
jgi:hypothetical protein